MDKLAFGIGGLGSTALGLYSVIRLLSALTTGRIELYSRFGSAHVLSLSTDPFQFLTLVAASIGLVVVTTCLAVICCKIVFSFD